MDPNQALTLHFERQHIYQLAAPPHKHERIVFAVPFIQGVHFERGGAELYWNDIQPNARPMLELVFRLSALMTGANWPTATSMASTPMGRLIVAYFPSSTHTVAGYYLVGLRNKHAARTSEWRALLADWEEAATKGMLGKNLGQKRPRVAEIDPVPVPTPVPEEPSRRKKKKRRRHREKEEEEEEEEEHPVAPPPPPPPRDDDIPAEHLFDCLLRLHLLHCEALNKALNSNLTKTLEQEIFGRPPARRHFPDRYALFRHNSYQDLTNNVLLPYLDMSEVQHLGNELFNERLFSHETNPHRELWNQLFRPGYGLLWFKNQPHVTGSLSPAEYGLQQFYPKRYPRAGPLRPASGPVDDDAMELDEPSIPVFGPKLPDPVHPQRWDVCADYVRSLKQETAPGLFDWDDYPGEEEEEEAGGDADGETPAPDAWPQPDFTFQVHPEKMIPGLLMQMPLPFRMGSIPAVDDFFLNPSQLMEREPIFIVQCYLERRSAHEHDLFIRALQRTNLPLAPTQEPTQDERRALDAGMQRDLQSRLFQQQQHMVAASISAKDLWQERKDTMFAPELRKWLQSRYRFVSEQIKMLRINLENHRCPGLLVLCTEFRGTMDQHLVPMRGPDDVATPAASIQSTVPAWRAHQPTVNIDDVDLSVPPQVLERNPNGDFDQEEIVANQEARRQESLESLHLSPRKGNGTMDGNEFDDVNLDTLNEDTLRDLAAVLKPFTGESSTYRIEAVNLSNQLTLRIINRFRYSRYRRASHAFSEEEFEHGLRGEEERAVRQANYLFTKGLQDSKPFLTQREEGTSIMLAGYRPSLGLSVNDDVFQTAFSKWSQLHQIVGQVSVRTHFANLLAQLAAKSCFHISNLSQAKPGPNIIQLGDGGTGKSFVNNQLKLCNLAGFVQETAYNSTFGFMTGENWSHCVMLTQELSPSSLGNGKKRGSAAPDPTRQNLAKQIDTERVLTIVYMELNKKKGTRVQKVVTSFINVITIDTGNNINADDIDGAIRRRKLIQTFKNIADSTSPEDAASMYRPDSVQNSDSMHAAIRDLKMISYHIMWQNFMLNCNVMPTGVVTADAPHAINELIMRKLQNEFHVPSERITITLRGHIMEIARTLCLLQATMMLFFAPEGHSFRDTLNQDLFSDMVYLDFLSAKHVITCAHVVMALDLMRPQIEQTEQEYVAAAFAAASAAREDEDNRELQQPLHVSAGELTGTGNPELMVRARMATELTGPGSGEIMVKDFRYVVLPAKSKLDLADMVNRMLGASVNLTLRKSDISDILTAWGNIKVTSPYYIEVAPGVIGSLRMPDGDIPASRIPAFVTFGSSSAATPPTSGTENGGRRRARNTQIKQMAVSRAFLCSRFGIPTTKDDKLKMIAAHFEHVRDPATRADYKDRIENTPFRDYLKRRVYKQSEIKRDWASRLSRANPSNPLNGAIRSVLHNAYLGLTVADSTQSERAGFEEKEMRTDFFLVSPPPAFDLVLDSDPQGKEPIFVTLGHLPSILEVSSTKTPTEPLTMMNAAQPHLSGRLHFELSAQHVDQQTQEMVGGVLTIPGFYFKGDPDFASVQQRWREHGRHTPKFYLDLLGEMGQLLPPNNLWAYPRTANAIDKHLRALLPAEMTREKRVIQTPRDDILDRARSLCKGRANIVPFEDIFMPKTSYRRPATVPRQ